MSDDPEQSQQVEASPSLPRMHTPLLNRFLTAAASPAVSLKNFGRSNRAHHHLLRLRGEGGFPSPNPRCGEDPEAVGRIEEEETEDEASEPPTPGTRLKVPSRQEASQGPRRENPQIRVRQPSNESIDTDQSAA